MRKLVLLLACALPLTACDGMAVTADKDDPSDRFMKPLPPAVRDMAAPYQDLEAVKLEPSTGCFVYRHVGPVETTFLPLRTRDGRPICTQQPEEPPAA